MGQTRGFAGWIGALALASTVGCGGGKGNNSDGGPGGTPGPGQTGTAGGGPAGACSDLFDQGMVRRYQIEISPDEWQKLNAEFHNIAVLEDKGNDFALPHPVTFRMGNDTAADATLRLHGQSSWSQTVMFDGDKAKMQFDISFRAKDDNARFHGVDKLVFDMSRDDWTFMHDRLAHAWMRQVGLAIGCAANGWVDINGQPYGLYVVEEHTGSRVLKQFFPGNSEGDLWKGGIEPQANQDKPNYDREKQYWAAKDIASLAAIVDLDGSVMEWAAEAAINNADGYYGGDHNFYLYDTGSKGFLFLPNDTDSTFEWMVLNDDTPFDDHPVFFWERRAQPGPAVGHAWLLVMNDPTWRAKYVDAVAAQLARWDVGQIQGWIDTWSKQIAADVAADPHAFADTSHFQMAIAAARDVVAKRAAFLQSFVDCAKGGAGDDKDGDGVRWCDDCRDDNAAIHPGAAEICGNGVDENCNGVPDDGC